MSMVKLAQPQDKRVKIRAKQRLIKPTPRGGALKRTTVQVIRSVCGDLSRTHLPYLIFGHKRRARRWQQFIDCIEPISLATLAQLHPATEIEEHIPCLLCGETTVQPLFSPGGASRKGKAWQYHVVRCPSCGFLYRNPNVRPERLGDLYSKNYNKHLMSDEYVQWRLSHYRSFLAAFSPMFDAGAGRRLLDFGCGNGLFMELAQSRGFDAWGVDLAADSVEAARQRLNNEQAFCGSPVDVPPIARGGFDIITLWSVLAHLPRPVQDFTMLRRLLKPGGALLVFTVNANSLLLKTFRQKWDGFTPNHLCFYSASTLMALGRRTGFETQMTRPYYGEGIEFGARPLLPPLANRVRRVIDQTDQGNMMRAVLIADGA